MTPAANPGFRSGSVLLVVGTVGYVNLSPG